MREPAVARIDRDEGEVGTAFATDRSTAVTAWHCLREKDNPKLALESTELRFMNGIEITARYVHGDPVEDWAILRLQTPLPEALEPVPLRRECEACDDCRCLGFPAATLLEGALGYLPVLATVSGETIREGARRIVVHAREVAARLNPAGMSGGPVIPRSGASESVGILSRLLLDEEGMRVGGVLFACPADLLADKPALAPEPPEPPEPPTPPEAPELPEQAIAPPTIDALTQLAQEGDVAAAAKVGQILRANDRPDEAEPWLRTAALRGSPSGAFELGLLLDPDGQTLHRDPDRAEEALQWFRKAAIGGDVYGAATMGVRLRQQGRNDAAMPWLEDAVERGDAMAAHTLGLIYDDAGDHAQAEQWHRFAAERSDQAAARQLALIARGRGETDEAIRWLALAPDDQHAQAELEQLRSGG